MKTSKSLFLAMGLAAALSTACQSNVDRIYASMTQEERVAQLHGIYLAQFFNADGVLDTARCKALIPNGIGHFSQYAVSDARTPDEMRDMVAQMQDWLMNNTPSGIPALFHEEVLSGVAAYDATVYPQQIGLAGSFNTELAEMKTRQTAGVLRAMGGALALSPMVDVVRNPSFNRLEESYGEDAFLSAAMGCAFVNGLQHGNLKEGVAATTKHFLGYGGGGDAADKELMEEILLPHETIIRTAGSRVLMTGYHPFRGTNAVANSYLQKDLLRDYLGFDGLTVSDYGSINQIPGLGDPVEKAAAALNAGNDVEFPEPVNYNHLQEAIDRGLTTQKAFETAVKRVLALKEELGLLDSKPYLYARGHIDGDTPEARQTAYELATQSVVLLENNGILPLRTPGKIALVGPNANTMWAMLGDYSYHSMRFFWQRQIQDDMHPRIVGLKEGLEARLPQGFSIGYSRGCDWTEEVETVIEDNGDERAVYMRSIQGRMVSHPDPIDKKSALELAAASDVIIAAVGENVILCGENRDRKGLRLPGKQEDFVRSLIATGKPVVLVIFGGRAQVVSGLADKCAAVIQAWYPGEEGGNALADIIYGNVNPSGKLSVSYPAEEIYEPICYNNGLEDDPRIAYPFGYGLSYTSFEYSNINCDSEVKAKSDFVNLAFTVTNTGSETGDEVAQVYISPCGASDVIKPIKLQGFARVSLEPGQSRQVRMAIPVEMFGYWTPDGWKVDAGRYILRVGTSSIDTEPVEVCIDGSRSSKLRSRYFPEVTVE